MNAKILVGAVLVLMLATTSVHAQLPQPSAAEDVVVEWNTVQGVMGHLKRSLQQLAAENESLKAQLKVAQEELVTLKKKEKP